MTRKLELAELNRLERERFVSHLGRVFEDSPWVAASAWDSRPFRDVDELHAAMVEAVRSSPEERKMSLIRAHPDLAGKAAVAGELTLESEGEQAAAGLDRLTPEEYGAFTKVNTAYREKFGFPMIVCVREHDKESILQSARSRLSHSREAEVATALDEIAKIARLRLEDLVENEVRTEGSGGVRRMMPEAGELLVSAEEIEAKIGELGSRINSDYRGQSLILVGILRGAVVFLSDLMRRLEVPCEIDFIEVSSYGAGTTTSGVVRILKDLREDISGRHVLVVEDIIDTGLTLSYLRRTLLARRPASLEICTLLSKPSRRRVELDVKYLGFEVPDEFVVGYGIDYAGYYRNLRDIRALATDTG